jgi:hypothetical protein
VQRQESPVMRPKEVAAPAPRVETREVIKEVIKEVICDSQKSAYCGFYRMYTRALKDTDL